MRKRAIDRPELNRVIGRRRRGLNYKVSGLKAELWVLRAIAINSRGTTVDDDWKLFLLVPDFPLLLSRSELNRAEFFGGLFPREDGADGTTEQVFAAA